MPNVREGRLRWAVRPGTVRNGNFAAERVLQQEVYVIENDRLEWRNIPEVYFPVEKFEPKS